MTEDVEAAMDRLGENAVHLYDVGDPYMPDGERNGAPEYKAARGTNLTEALNSLMPIMMRGGSCSLILAVCILQSALVSNMYFISQLLYKRFKTNMLINLLGQCAGGRWA